MNIAFFSEMARIEGSAYHMLRQARWMATHGHRAIMISSGGPLEADLAALGIPHICTPSTLQGAQLDVEQLIADGAAVERACREYAIDAVISAASLPFSLASAAVGSWLPVYFNVLSLKYFAPATQRTAVAMQSAAADGRIIAYSREDVVPHAQRFGFDPGLARLAPFPIDNTHSAPTRPATEVRSELGITDDTIAIVTASRLDPDKSHYILPLANAVLQLRSQLGINLRLFVVGDGQTAEHLRAQAPQETVFLGMRRDLGDLLNAADVFCGEGSTLADAALAKLPIVCSNALVMPEMGHLAFAMFGVQSFELRWRPSRLAPLTDFYTALEPIVRDRALRASLGEAAHDAVTSAFSMDRYMTWLLSVVKGEKPPDLLSDNRARVAIKTDGSLENLSELGAALAVLGDRYSIGLDVQEDVPWSRLLKMPIEHASALGRAAVRTIDDSVPRFDFETQALRVSAAAFVANEAERLTGV